MRIDLSIVNTASWGVKKYFKSYQNYFSYDHLIVFSTYKLKIFTHFSLHLRYIIYNRKMHTWFPTGIIPIFASNFSVTIHDLIPLLDSKNYNWFYRIYLKCMLRYKLPQASNIYTVSHTVADELKSIFKIKNKIIVTYNFTDLINFYTPKEENIFPVDYFLYVGNFAAHKGLKNLLSLWTKVPFVLVCVVDKRDPQCMDYGLQNNVIFLDKCDEIWLTRLFANSKGLIFPSTHEGFGIPGIEANALNRRVVYNNIPVFTEIFSYSERNICFDFNNGDYLKLVSILKDLTSDFGFNDTVPHYFSKPENIILEC
jgi:glycosyltransferase involved in cell wall biosynthesis